MRANRRVDTKPEVEVRSLLHAQGLRFRKDYAVATGIGRVRPDIAFPRRRLAVFIDGCFWHQCPEHGLMPERNRAYWEPKLRRNMERDERVNSALATEGWRVLRFWEHEPSDEVAAAIAREL